MKRYIPAAFLLFSLLAGCGGEGGSVGSSGTQVSGNVTDLNGNAVRNANVFLANRTGTSTRTNSTGSYILASVPEGDRVIRAEIVQDGIKYVGENYARVFADERSKSVNITMGRENQVARMNGVVRDRNGALLAGARVFANAGTLSSNMAVTDENGEYEMGGLFGGITYTVNAGGAGFNSDRGTITLNAGENRRVDFQLNSPTDTLLPAPQNLSVVIWTSPQEATRTKKAQDAYEGIKRAYDKKRAARMTKSIKGKTASGRPIEADLSWNPIRNNALLGYGIYRGTSQNGPTSAIDFLRDPETGFFADSDDALREYVNYYYEITALSTSFPDTNNSESDFSDRYGVRALGDLNTGTVTQNPLTFRWNNVPEAESYIVFVFDRYPGIDVQEIHSQTTNGTSAVYNGPQLVDGRRYYWVVLGLANNNDSRTISRIAEFTAN